MGLDSVELLIRVEQEFGIDIPDRDAERLTTPRTVADYICTRIELAPTVACLTRSAFYRIRAAMVADGVAPQAIHPTTRFADVYAGPARRRA